MFISESNIDEIISVNETCIHTYQHYFDIIQIEIIDFYQNRCKFVDIGM